MPGTYLHPGVYIEEVSGGARPIEAVGTSTAAFVGVAEKGPINEARFVTNFTEFQQIYGGYVKDDDLGASYLTYAVYAFFQNGGKSCYVVRVEYEAETAELTLYTDEDSGGLKTMTVKAISPGKWGNDLRIAIGPGTTSPDEAFNMYVYVKDELKETYEDASMVDTNLFFIDRIVKKHSTLISVESESLPDNPIVMGTKSEPFNLSIVKQIKLQVDAYGPYVIDCSENAVDVAQVKAKEVCACINKAFQNDIDVPVAYEVSGKVKIASPTADDDSQIVFSNPASKDATYDIFGLQESSWIVKGTDQAIAMAQGLETAANINTNLGGGSKTITIGLGTAAVVPVTLAQGADATATLFGVVYAINTALSASVAYTDGAHVILKSNEDIKMSQTNASLIFGSGLYAYVHTGSGSDPASITGTAAAVPVNGDVKLKIDSVPAFTVSLVNTDTADTVVAKINTAFQKASKSKKKVADTVSGKVTVSSIETGASGRIIVSSHTGTDAAASIFGTAHTNAADYLFTAETLSVASIVGTRDLSAGIGTDLAGKKLRMAVSDATTQFTVSSAAAATTQALFTADFAGKTALNYRLLTAGATAEMVAVSSTGTAEIYFSVPLKGATETEEAEVGEDAQKAYKALFGDISPFTGAIVTAPKYTYEFGAPDNRPAETSTNLALTGGYQKRSEANKVRDLVTGTDGVNGLRRLDALTDVSILVIPGWESMGGDIAKTFINEGTAYCDKTRPAQARPLRDLFFVADMPVGVTKPDDARNYVQNNVTKSSGGYSAIYYPWFAVNDPIGTKSTTISVPPSGAIAGLYASIDGRRGVWKAPAGTEAGLAGVVSLADQVNDIKQDILNPFGVNAIRKMPGAGIVSWGARTLATNPEWKYIPVRRMAIMMEVSIYEGIQWAVFEPNDEPLWSLLRLNINAFMMNLYRNGAFQGATPEDAFFVKCDSETTTQIDIDLGKVNILVGFAPLKPAEFVIVKISQKAGKQD